LERAVRSSANVLIRGESGSGKRLLAATIHALSPQGSGPLVSVDCRPGPHAALDAKTFVEAQHGTLVLDEIMELGSPEQTALLQLLDDVCSSAALVNARVICLTSGDPTVGVETERFDAVLLERLGMQRVYLPPLRARGNDVLHIAESFIAKFSQQSGKAVQGLSSEAADRLLAYGWPGNIEELRTSMRCAVSSAQGEHVGRNDLPEAILRTRASPFDQGADAARARLEADADVLEQRYVLAVLDAVNGDEADAASMLGIDRQTLRNRLRRYRRR
jgi:two-component system response regulator HydG